MAPPGTTIANPSLPHRLGGVSPATTISSPLTHFLPKITIAHYSYCYLFCYLTTIVLIVQSYNLDTQKALPKYGQRGSYFGYSLAQHATFDQQQKDGRLSADLLPRGGIINRNRSISSFRSSVLVGAPRANNTRSLTGGVIEPGAVYECDFSLASQCQPIDIDSLAHSNHVNIYHLPSFPADNGTSISGETSSLTRNGQPTGQLLASAMDPVVQRDNQWLGVTVKSQGPNGYVMACAHRYVLKGFNYRWGQGICYSLTKNLTFHKTWQPCLNRPVNKAHEEYGYCQVGTSGDISDSSDIVLGAPGVYTWRGTVFSNSISFTAKDDRSWYMAPVQDENAKVNKYSYLGMSLVSGRFFNKQQYYVSGSPRSNDVGQVLIMTKQNIKGETNFRTDQIIDGEQVASSFGYSLAKIDFNNDGRLDLVVGAPFYYSKAEGGGAVYAFSNNGKALVPSGKLTAGKPEARFGFALANCGDLNQDKYEDLAVGAPYEPAGGAVYIYHGSAQGLKTKPAQRIEASAVASNLQTFGYSLSGGLDMDQNGYPDLVVGSYADDAIFILRARPIIEIHTKIDGDLSRIDPNKSTCDGEKSPLPCFKFSACFELDPAKVGEYTDTIKIKYRIEAETFAGRKYSRVKFHDSENSPLPHIVEKEILIDDYYRGAKLKRCNTQRVYIKDRSDILTPIPFKLTYELVPPSSPSSGASGSSQPAISNRYSSYIERNLVISSLSSASSSSGNLPSSSLPSPSSSTSSVSLLAAGQQDSPASKVPPPFPILNQEEAQRLFTAYFLKDCGPNDICESQLEVDGQLQLPKETLGINEPGFSYDKQANLTINVANRNEPAYEARLFVTHPASLTYSGFKASKQVSIIECSSIEKSLVKCDLGNPMTKGASKLMMIFNTQNQAGTFDFNLMVNTTSQNAENARASYDLSGTIRKKTEVPISTRPPVVHPETPTQDPPGWLILASILLGILLFSALFYCLWINGFFERSKAQYRQADTEERFN